MVDDRSQRDAAGSKSCLPVVDGDTLKVDGVTYRLWGIDAPKSGQPCADGWPQSVRASVRLLLVPPGTNPAGRAPVFGGFAKGIACGLAVRHDHGSQYMSDHFQKEITFLGIESSPAFIRAPEGNGCAERSIRTLKENLLWLRHFETIEELRQALLAFRETYNTTWFIERHEFSARPSVRNSFNPSLGRRSVQPGV